MFVYVHKSVIATQNQILIQRGFGCCFNISLSFFYNNIKDSSNICRRIRYYKFKLRAFEKSKEQKSKIWKSLSLKNWAHLLSF